MEYMDKDLDIIISEALSQVDEIELPDGFHNKLLVRIKTENNQIVSRETKKNNIFSFKKYALLAAAIAIMFISIRYMKPIDVVSNDPMLASNKATMQKPMSIEPDTNAIQDNSEAKENIVTYSAEGGNGLRSTPMPNDAPRISAALVGIPDPPYIDNPIFAIGLLAILLIFIKIIQLKSK